MDPQKIEELNENLYQLNQAVQETDSTFMDVLGPMASSIQEKLQKESNQSANSQNSITNQLQSTYTKSQLVANKQNEIFKRQLARRGYEIDATGKEIKIDTQLSKSQLAQLEKLDKAIIKERELVQATDKPVQKFREISGNINSLEGLLGKLEDKMFEIQLPKQMIIESKRTKISKKKVFDELTEFLLSDNKKVEIDCQSQYLLKKLLK